DAGVLAVARTGMGFARIPDGIVIAGGCDGVDGGSCAQLSPGVVRFLGGADGGISAKVLPSLPTPEEALSLTEADGRLVATGGTSLQGATNAVLSAQFESDGGTSPWTALTALPAPRSHHASFVLRGRLFVAGGRDAAGQDRSDVLFADIRPDGTLGPWQSGPSLPSARSELSAATYGTQVFLVGGAQAGAPSSSVLVASWTPNGLSPWTAGPALPQPMAATAAVSSAGYLYALGGYSTGGAKMASAFAAPVLDRGGLGDWRSLPSLPDRVSGAAAFAGSEWLFVAGGTLNDGGVSSALAFAPIDGTLTAQGELGNFRTSFPLNVVRVYSCSVSTADHLYVIGGCSRPSIDGTCPDAGDYRDDVEIAALDPDGGLAGPWTISPQRLPHGVHRFGCALVDGNLMVFGGSTNVTYADVLRAPIAADGSLGPWDAGGAPLPNSIGECEMRVRGRQIFVAGGLAPGAPDGGAAQTNALRAAPIFPDGTVGSFAAVSTFGLARFDPLLQLVDDNAYIFGGWGGTSLGTLGDVQRTSFAPDASVPPFVDAGVLINARVAGGSENSAGFIYLVGGANAMTTVPVEVVRPLDGGVLGPWAISQSQISAPRMRLTVERVGDTIYAMGGQDFVASYNTVDLATFQHPTRVGTLSGAFDFAQDGTLHSVTVDGDAGRDVLQLALQTASEDGGYGSWSSFSASFGVPVVLELPATRFVRLELVLDGNGTTQTDAFDSAPAFVNTVSADFTPNPPIQAGDAGVDGGLDAGPSAGADAGADAGNGESRPPMNLDVSCGCGSGAGMIPFLSLMLACALLSRRPHAARRRRHRDQRQSGQDAREAAP
ncbi:MAG: hypothetical protein ACJ790_22875, partial [Myxococcaceae bacterium]